MKVEISQKDNQVLVAVEGRVDTLTSSDFEKQLSPYFSMQDIELVLDCAAMEYISSAGLRVVLMAHKNISARAGRFAIRHLNSEVRSVFDMTGFSRILTIE